jgi:hypothetical protein
LVRTAWPFEWAQTIAPPVNTVVGQTNYALPADCLELIAIHCNTGAIDSRILKGLPQRNYALKWQALDFLPRDKPTDYSRINQALFSVAPIPNSNTYKLAVIYVQRKVIVDLNVDLASTTPDPFTIMLPARYHEVLVKGVAARMAVALRDSQKFTEADAQFRAIIGNMIVEDKRQPDTNFELRPFRGAPYFYQTTYWANPFVREIK